MSERVSLRKVVLLVPVIRDGASVAAGSVIAVPPEEAVRLLQSRQARLYRAAVETATQEPQRK